MNVSKINTIKNKPINKTLEGVLVNTHVKDNPQEISFDDVSNDLLMTNKSEDDFAANPETKNSFDMKKALLPLAIGTGAFFLSANAISYVINKSSKAIANSKAFEQLPDLALNMNIKQEPQFVMYRMLRDPNFSNVFGACCVFLFSILTAAAKNFVDGAKDIWIKKQNADIERDLQEQLISVEAQEFSGKLNVINNMLNDNVNYFKNTFEKNNSQKNANNFFKAHFSFKGGDIQNKQANNEPPENKNLTQNNKKKKNLLYAGMGILSVGVLALLGKSTFKNLKNTVSEASKFANDYTEGLIDAIEKIASENDTKNVSALEQLFQSINAKPEYIKEVLRKMNVAEDEIQNVIQSVERSKKEIFADAPTALGGIPKKIQYYCYLDEDRGHLYNWATHPENKFAKYIFISFASITAVGYIMKQAFDAVKTVTVNKENAKTELGLKQRLVEVGINNFKAKKESAINPMLDTFESKRKEGKSEEELKQYAQNILTEIKNGPPYVYS